MGRGTLHSLVARIRRVVSTNRVKGLTCRHIKAAFTCALLFSTLSLLLVSPQFLLKGGLEYGWKTVAEKVVHEANARDAGDTSANTGGFLRRSRR